MAVSELRVMGRATQGVRLIKINEGDAIAAVTKVDVEEEGQELEEINADTVVEENESDIALDSNIDEPEN
jgi:DNA gyrase subunit A